MTRVPVNDRSTTPVPLRVRQMLRVEVVRYGLVGILNTLIGYGLFVVLQLALGRYIHYTIVQAIANLIGVVEAYWLQRWLVFRSRGNWWAGLGKFASVYAAAFVFSLGMVALLVEVFGAGVLLAGAVTLILQAFLTYAANKWFTFRPQGDPRIARSGRTDDRRRRTIAKDRLPRAFPRQAGEADQHRDQDPRLPDEEGEEVSPERRVEMAPAEGVDRKQPDP